MTGPLATFAATSLSHDAPILTPKSDPPLPSSDDSTLTSLGSILSSRSDDPSPPQTGATPCRGPQVWSETRQELCESLPYYRAFQSGSYVKGSSGKSNVSIKPTNAITEQAIVKGSLVLGYLLGGWPSMRDVWAHQGRVIISHGGGKNATQDDQDPLGNRHQARETTGVGLKDDQTEEQAVIASLIATMKTRSPLVLIAAENYALLPFKLNCGFAVMGWYIITDGWAEKEVAQHEPNQQSFVRCKFRFEWVQAQGDPWWTVSSPGRTLPWNPRERTERFDETHRQLHRRKLEHLCSQHSVLPSDIAEVPNDAAHHKKRLKTGPMKAKVKLLSQSSWTSDLVGKETPPLLGRRKCRACGHQSSEVFRVGWMCLQPKCPKFFSHKASRPGDLEFNEAFLAVRGDRVTGGFPGGVEPFSIVPAWPSDESTDQSRGLWCPDCGRLSCRVIVYKPTCSHCQQPVGPKKRLPPISALRFNPSHAGSSDASNTILSVSSSLRASIKRGGGLIVFSFTFPDEWMSGCAVHVIQANVDAGAPEHQANRLFRLFQEAAWPDDNDDTAKNLVPFRRHPLSHHMGKGQVLTQQFTCNYGVAYKHVVAMGTHPLDGSEPVAVRGALDLIEQRTRHACPAGAQPFNELYPVLYLDHQKMSFHDDGEPGLGPIVSSLSLGAEATMRFRVKNKHLSQLGVAARDRVLLSLRLRHGSVCVQQGADLQRFMEHMVQPSGFRIAATARSINAQANQKTSRKR